MCSFCASNLLFSSLLISSHPSLSNTMGSSSSRLASRPSASSSSHRVNRFRLSSLLCGTSTSRSIHQVPFSLYPQNPFFHPISLIPISFFTFSYTFQIQKIDFSHLGFILLIPFLTQRDE